MTTLEKMRAVADLLFRQRKFNEAYTIYDELYKQIWGVFGIVQSSLTGNSNDYFRTRFSTFQILWKQHPDPIVNALCLRILKSNLPSVLHEFIHVIYGHLQCIVLSQQTRKEIAPDAVLSEFALLYTLALLPVHQQKISSVFAISTALVDKNNRVKRILSNHSQRNLEALLIEHACNCKIGKWKEINRLLFNYLTNIGQQKSDFFRRISSIVGPSSFNFQNTQYYSDRHSTYTRYESFDQYERYRQQKTSSSHKSYPSITTDEEKKVYYGHVIGLTGNVTKEQIHAKYIKLVSLYHPDKVQHLGPELRELAESKTKEINAAYNWLKSKYHI